MIKLDTDYNNSISIRNDATKYNGHSLQIALQNPKIPLETLKDILSSNPALVTAPLPNGDLPLHFAVKESHFNNDETFDKITLLLNSGCTLEQKDEQHLTALDHAALLRNERLLGMLLGIKVGNEMQAVQEQVSLPQGETYLEDVLKNQQTLSEVNDRQVLTSLQYAAYTGDLSTHSLTEMLDAPADSQGQKPIHYAIKGKQSECVKALVTEMRSRQLDLNHLDIFKHNLLHFAVAIDALDIAEFLIKEGISLNQKNTRGMTPLHYAATKDHLHHLQMLIKAGANPQSLDSSGRSPLALYHLAAFQKDPLHVKETQLIVFATTALYWTIQLANNSGWPIPYSTIILTGAFLASSLHEFVDLLNNLKQSWSKFAAYLSYFALSHVPVFNFIFPLWRTAYLAQDTLKAVKAAKKHARYRKWDAAYKLAINTANTTFSIHTLYRRFQYNKWLYDLYKTGYLSELYQDVCDKYDFLQSLYTSSNWEEILNKLLKYTFGDEFESNDPYEVECPPVTGSYENLSHLERTSSADLNPKCPEHAAMILSPTFDQEKFCSQVKSTDSRLELRYLNKIFRQVSVKLHPDKHPNNIDAATKGFQQLGNAKETLENELKKLNYCK